MLRNWTQSVCVFSIIVTVVVTTFCSTTISAKEAPQHVRDRHKAAVEVARKGDFSTGLMQLDSLIYDFPDFYPAKRDYVIIAAWAEKCDLALTRFRAIRRESPLEGYLVEPVSECLRDLRRVDEAMALLKASLAKNRNDGDAKRAYNNLKAYVERESRPTLRFSRGYSKSKRTGDNGNTAQPGSGESQELTYTQEITSNVRAYYRHLLISGRDKRFKTGNVSRASIGARTWFGIMYLLDTEVFTELDAKNQEGVRVNLSYFPNNLWEFSLDHSTAAEDTPLRARAYQPTVLVPVNPDFIPIKAVRTRVNTSFNTEDYRWELSANYSYYHFSDTNKRRSLGASLAYAYILRDKYEQRVLFNLGSTRNEPLNVSYYNPETRTVGIRATHVYQTSWERMVDNLTLTAGFYDQKGENQKRENRQTIWDITYALELEFTALHALSLSVDYAKRYYDGNGEYRRGLYISYSRKL